MTYPYLSSHNNTRKRVAKGLNMTLGVFYYSYISSWTDADDINRQTLEQQ